MRNIEQQSRTNRQIELLFYIYIYVHYPRLLPARAILYVTIYPVHGAENVP